jgi:hypothetical protein
VILGVGALFLGSALMGCSNSPGTSPTGRSASHATVTRAAPSPTNAATTTTGPAPSTTASTQSSSVLREGPGPQSTYTVQSQPAPGTCHYGSDAGDPLPDPHCTPGALNPQVTQTTIGSTICRSGYTSSIRPPESVTEPEKRASAAAYTYTGTFSTGEYDHLVPLELGGDPNDPANLWVEPNDNPNATSTANAKDVLENKLNNLVCGGQLALATAQNAIASNWVTAYHQYVGALPSSPAASASPPAPAAPSSGSATCTASATPANDGYRGDYDVSVTSNQPGQKATASDARDSWSGTTDAAGDVRILLYYVSPGEQITVTVGAAPCSTVAP